MNLHVCSGKCCFAWGDGRKWAKVYQVMCVTRIHHYLDCGTSILIFIEQYKDPSGEVGGVYGVLYCNSPSCHAQRRKGTICHLFVVGNFGHKSTNEGLSIRAYLTSRGHLISYYSHP